MYHQLAKSTMFHLNMLLGSNFLKERRPSHLTTSSPLPTCQSHRLKTHTKLPTPRDMLSLELVTKPLRKKSMTTFKSSINDLERMKSEPFQMRLEVGEEKSLMQQPCKVALRKNMNPT